MTRKTALKQAIAIIQSSDVEEEIAGQIIEKLQLCLDELPFTKWTQASIFDACDQYIEEHGKLVINDFYKHQLPTHSSIRLHFGMTAAQFRDTYYPLTKEQIAEIEYEREELLRLVKQEIIGKGLYTRWEYDKHRKKTLPCGTTILARYEFDRWAELLAHLEIDDPRKCKREKFREVTLAVADSIVSLGPIHMGKS